MRTIFIILLSLATCIISGQSVSTNQWPSYRGFLSSGVLEDTNLPDTFSISSGLNIKWKADVPGLGLSSPVIWDNKLFITTAIGKSGESGLKTGLFGDVTSVNDSSVHEWKVLCFDKNTGKLIWERTAYKGIPAIKRHPKSSHANTSVATDGKVVVAFFGSEGMYCYDMNGKLLWEKKFGVLKSAFFSMPGAQWEFASSPVIYNGSVIIQCDVLDNPFIAALDVKTGKELWRTKRDDYPAWSTPNIYEFEGKNFVVVNGFRHIGGYSFDNGSEIWKMSGGGDIPIPTPVIGKDKIYLNGSHGKFSPVIAVNKSAKGDITLKEGESSNQYVSWSKPRGGSYMHTMLLYRGKLYNIGWNGSVSCLNPDTGTEIYNGKLGKARSFVASPVASDGKIYVVDEEGTVYILSDGNELKVISEIPLGEKSLTAPALTKGMIFFRTQKGLVAVGK